MNEIRNNTNDTPTPEQARAALDRAASSALDTTADRRVHARATMAFGLLVAVFTALSHWLGDDTFRGDFPFTAFYVLLVLAVAAAQNRLARSWPAGTRRLSSIGVGLSAVVAFVGGMVLNYVYRDSTPAVWAGVTLAVLAAVPSLVAGALILRDRR